MASHDFFFALEFSSQGAPAPLVEELASQVLKYVGCTATPVPQMTAALEHAVAKTTAGGERRCDVQFRAHAGKLDILITSNGGRVFQETVAIP